MAEENESAEERTEQATTQRREDFRKAGQVAQSREIGTILILLSVTLVFYFLSRNILLQISGMLNSSFTEYLLRAAREHDLLAGLKALTAQGFLVLLPVFLVVVVIGIFSSVAQIGFLSAWENIEPNLERINPISNLGRLFNLRSLMEGLKSLAKIIIVGAVAFLVLKKELKLAPQLVQMAVPQILTYIGFAVFKLIGGICALLGLLAIVDYFFQRWDLEKRMRMTKQEVKQEVKQREGDPLIKSRIRRIQRELAQKRMMEKVPKADVIVTNPTHIAVALQYDRSAMAAPVMVAKGADLIAEKIKEIARKHQIPIIENKPLARTIFKTLKIGQAIPRSLYNAVAEVLAYVYKVKGKIKDLGQEVQSQL